LRLIVNTLKSVEQPNLQRAAGEGAVVDAPSCSLSQSSFGLSGSDKEAVSARPSTHASQTRQERRRQKRAGVKLAARVRPANLGTKDSYEVLVTVNASRQSLYFTTTSERYRLGMRLRVIFPYGSAHDCVAASEDDGEVTRTERLPNKLIGVAVQLRSPAHAARSPVETVRPSVSRGAVAERRIAIRHLFSAEAVVVVDSHANIRLQARCSDLSLEGCYIDTLNPFPKGTISRVELRTAEIVFEAIARVNSSHVGMGMGLCFQDLTPEQTSVLVHCLTNEPDGRMSVANPPEITKQDKSKDRTVAIELVRHMLSKGILTKADITDIFVNPVII
jgi:hypothetical protein